MSEVERNSGAQTQTCDLRQPCISQVEAPVAARRLSARLSDGRRQFTGNMTVFFLRRDAGGSGRTCRCESVLPWDGAGRAVERNRIKRRMREAVRLRWPRQEAPVDVVFNPAQVGAAPCRLPMWRRKSRVGYSWLSSGRVRRNAPPTGQVKRK